MEILRNPLRSHADLYLCEVAKLAPRRAAENRRGKCLLSSPKPFISWRATLLAPGAAHIFADTARDYLPLLPPRYGKLYLKRPPPRTVCCRPSPRRGRIEGFVTVSCHLLDYFKSPILGFLLCGLLPIEAEPPMAKFRLAAPSIGPVERFVHINET